MQFDISVETDVSSLEGADYFTIVNKYLPQKLIEIKFST